jgi:hypothetical protein
MYCHVAMRVSYLWLKMRNYSEWAKRQKALLHSASLEYAGGKTTNACLEDLSLYLVLYA